MIDSMQISKENSVMMRMSKISGLREYKCVKRVRQTKVYRAPYMQTSTLFAISSC
jgi:hypothetical protein